LHLVLGNRSWNYAKPLILLLDSGASVNAKDNDGITPLMVATSQSSSGELHILLSYGADVNIADNRGCT
jgi:uncharacterized protein